MQPQLARAIQQLLCIPVSLLGKRSSRLQPTHRPSAGDKGVDFQAELLQHRHEQIRQGIVVLLIKRQVLPMPESTARQQNRHIPAVMVAGVAKIGSEQNHGLVQ